MAYQSLYRRYRSQRFAEVLGQDHVTTALRNAVRESRVAQGYLFSGPRGTGKTSTARILAKVLNCAAPVDGEPCTECEACVAVAQGRAVDWLHELDAASNNGVADMRELLARVSMGTSGNRKVYILDEVHMLSAGASNALLKTLEEPPEHVIFVLATTEPEKVLPTIRSRTQHFEFHLLGADVLADHVRYVISDADLGLGEDAVDHVVAAGKGSARDTLSALDQVAAAGGVAALGTPVDDLVDALGARDAGAALVAVEEAARTGRDPRTLATALVGELRNAFLVAMGAPATGLTDQAAQRASDISASMGPAALTGALEAVGAALVEMRHAPDARIPLEVALVQLTRPEASADLGALARRVAHLEQVVAGGATPTPQAEPIRASAAPEPAGTAAGSSPARARGPQAARQRLAERGPSPATDGAEASTPDASVGETRAPDRPTLGAMRKSPTSETGSPSDAGTSSEAGPPDNAHPSAETPTASPAEVPSEPSPPSPAPSGDAPDADAVNAAWEDSIRDGLSKRASAMYRLGRFVAGPRGLRFAVPSEGLRRSCEGKLDEVQEALERHFGRRIPVELVVDESTESPTPESPTIGTPQPDDDPDPMADAVDPDELIDAPDSSTGGLARLQDAFPGAELLEEP